MKPETVKTLRQGEPIRFFNRVTKTFIHFQLNRNEKRICWERYASLDKRNWVKQASHYSLKDINNFVLRLNNKTLNNN